MKSEAATAESAFGPELLIEDLEPDGQGRQRRVVARFDADGHVAIVQQMRWGDMEEWSPDRFGIRVSRDGFAALMRAAKEAGRG